MKPTSLNFDVKTEDYLVWQGQIVMSRSEEPYFRKLFERIAKELRPRRVLEIGFGLGISAELVQRFLLPAEHHIVELDTGIHTDLVQFARLREGIVPYLGDWRSASLPIPFDLVFYDPFDYCSEPDSDVCDERLLKRLVGAEGALCHPHFGDGPPRPLLGFRTVIVERFLVPEIEMADGTRCGYGAAVLCYPDS